MKKFFALCAVAVLSVSVAQAGAIKFTGDVGERPSGATSGVLNVVFDLDPQDNLANGGVDMRVVSSDPTFLAFGDAEVINGGRWTIAADVSEAASIQFNASSVLTPGLGAAGGQGVVFATIPYTILKADGSSTISVVLPAEAGIVDGRDFGTDVTANYTVQPAAVSLPGGPIVPEPATLAMLGMGAIGLVLRRRNG